MSDFDDHLATADRFHRSLAALRAHQKFVREALARHGYDRNQPRVPAGHREGGQWTKSGGGTPARGAIRREVEVDRSGEESWGSYVSSYRDDGSLAEQRVFNRDGSRIVSEFKAPGDAGGWDERHTVITPDGDVSFETTGKVQRISDGEGRTISESIWTDAGPEPLPPVQLAYQQRPSPLEPEIPLFRGGGGLPPSAPAPVPASPGLFALAAEAAEQLFSWLSRRNSRSRTAVLGFTAREYVSPGTKEAPGPLWVGYLTEDDVNNACREYDKAQTWTNGAAGKVRRSNYETASAYGTAVHLALKREIESRRLAPRRGDSLAEESGTSMLPEISLLKTLDETGELPKYGEKGSLRLDVLDPDRDLIFTENEETHRLKIANAGEVRTVCNYDIKTEKSRLLPGRSFEIARSVLVNFPRAERIIVVEIKPRN